MPNANEARKQSGPQLYTLVRLSFLEQNNTLSGWCRQNGLTRQYVEKCLKYERDGVAARALRDMVTKAAGLEL